MKHILIVETPDTIPAPEFLVEARCAGTFDEYEPVEFREVVLPDDGEIWQPRHSGTYQECDTVINGVTYYYFKKL